MGNELANGFGVPLLLKLYGTLTIWDGIYLSLAAYAGQSSHKINDLLPQITTRPEKDANLITKIFLPPVQLVLLSFVALLFSFWHLLAGLVYYTAVGWIYPGQGIEPSLRIAIAAGVVSMIFGLGNYVAKQANEVKQLRKQLEESEHRPTTKI